MSDTLASLSRKMGGAADLESVVRSMKALAASSIGQYEKSLQALEDYYHTLELGLVACMQGRASHFARTLKTNLDKDPIDVVVFGSDQGLVGQFNDVLADFTANTLNSSPGPKRVWAVGERVHSRLVEAGLEPIGLFQVPVSVNAITPLVGQILMEIEAKTPDGKTSRLSIFHNRPNSGADFKPVHQQLLPLDAKWRANLLSLLWPTKILPEVVGSYEKTLHTLMQALLFVSIFKACAESLASENASRLAAMTRAEKNINELLVDLNYAFRRLRQQSIDEELFDVVAGYESQRVTTPSSHSAL